VLISVLFAAVALGQEVPPDRWNFEDPEAMAIYNQGVRALDRAEPSIAEAQFRTALQKEPRAASGWYALALALVNQDRAADAVPILERVSLHHPRTDVMVELSRAYFAVQDFDSAEQTALGPVMRAPADLRVQNVYQWALLRKGRYDDALASLEMARSVRPLPAWDCLEVRIHADRGDMALANEKMVACRTSDATDLIAAAQAMLSPTGAEETALIRARDLADDGRVGEALALMTTWLLNQPNDLPGRLMRGSLYVNAGDYEAAKKDLHMVFSSGAWVEVEKTGTLSGIVTKGGERQLESQLRRGAALLVLVHAETGTAAEGLTLADRASAQFGDFPALAVARGRALLTLSQRDAAWERVRAALESPTDRAFVLEVAAEMAYQDSQGAPDDVAERVRAAGDWRLHYNVAVGLANAGRDEACSYAVDQGMSVVADDTQGATTLSLLGYGCSLNAGDLDRAGRYADGLGVGVDASFRLEHARLLAAAQRDEDAIARLDLAPLPRELTAAADTLRLLLYMRTDRLDQALNLATDGSDPRVLLHLGVKLAAADRVEARSMLERACPALEGQYQQRCQAVLAELPKG
jgi:tetratricopeptide (TPR) repeat protein